MRSRIKVITLGVDDLQRPVAFYRDGMGLPTQGIEEVAWNPAWEVPD